MRFRQNKVWAEADAEGRPAAHDGRVRIKYQLDQPHEYGVRAESLKTLEETTQAEARPPAKRRQRVAAATEAGMQGREEPGIHIYTDGASSGNPGPSGIGVVLRYGDRCKEISEYIGTATNNIAELTAIQRGLAAVRQKHLPVRLHTDSGYALGMLSLNWKPKANHALIAAIRKSMAEFRDLKLIKVRGHQGIADNERADKLATSAIRKKVG
jgi:ribonuclease HI